LGEKGVQVRAADFLLALDHQEDVDRKTAGGGKSGIHAEDVGQSSLG